MGSSIHCVKGIASLLGLAALALAFGVAAASAPAPAPTYATHLLGSDDSVDVAIADFNGDGRGDIVTANYNPGSVEVGGKQYRVGGLAGRVEPSDLNGDGRPDLVVEAEGDVVFVAVLLNKGAGSFGSATPVLDNAGLLTIGDVTSDDRPDVVSVSGGKLTVVANRGNGTFAPPTTYDAHKDSLAAAIGDVDADGKPDIELTSDDGTLSVFRGNGDGTFEQPVEYGAGAHPSPPALGDLNGDGKADVVAAARTGNSVGVFLSSDGTLEPRRDFTTAPAPDWVAIRDLNGDGKLDLLVAGRGAKALSVLLNNGDGSFQPARKYPTWRDEGVQAVHDLNGDGTPDVVMLNPYAQVVTLLLNRGDGSFQPKLDYVPALELWRGIVAVGDLNGDKRPDMVVPVGNSRNNWTYLSVFLNKPGLCNVQRLGGLTLAAAKQQLARVNCRVGKVRRVFSNWVAKGHVVAQKPRFGAERPRGTRVNLVVSKGRWS